MNWLNYQHLLYFWAVAQEGSLSKASRLLGLTPQTISAQLRMLEEVLGEDLFDRTGRTLVLNEAGQSAYLYANEIFSLGRELMDSFKGRAHTSGLSIQLHIGIANVLPKLIVHRLLEPAMLLEEPIRLVCQEERTDRLLAALALHELDVVLSDAPIPPTVNVRAYNHLLGECGVIFMAKPPFVAAHRSEFPRCLDSAPMLLPTEDTVLRRTLEQWLDARDIRPNVVGEFADSALLKVFGQAGAGVFAVPSVIEEEVKRQFGVQRLGAAEGLRERFYAISAERKVQHPAVAAICDAARTELFAG